MNRDEALQYITDLKKYRARPELDKLRNMLELMGNPQDQLRYIHIGGTNGKGSTAAMCRSVTRQAGYITGGFISPFLQRFNERIQVQDEPVSDEELIRLTEYIKGIGEEMAAAGMAHPTRFETITAMAFRCWHEKKCDIVGLEVGLGGRTDATNVIPAPEAVILTPVSFDHMHILGDSLREIAREKCGIIKPGSPVICYVSQPAEVMETIRETCAEKGNRLIIPDLNALEIISEGSGGTVFRYKGLEINIPLPGRHQVMNALSVIEAMFSLRQNGWHITDQDIAAGLASVKWPGRLERVSEHPECVLDGAHNLQAVKNLGETTDALFPGRRMISVMGILKDKDYKSCIPEIARRSDIMIMVKPDSVRALSAEEAAEAAAGYCPHTETAESVAAGLDRAFELAGKEDLILVCGSLFVVGAARDYFGLR